MKNMNDFCLSRKPYVTFVSHWPTVFYSPFLAVSCFYLGSIFYLYNKAHVSISRYPNYGEFYQQKLGGDDRDDGSTTGKGGGAGRV
jgi:hypothetical protein